MAKAASTDGLILEALERALADPALRKLHGTTANPGIFLSSAVAAKAAAQRCLELQLIEPRGEQKSKAKSVPLYGIAPQGVAYLLQHAPVPQLLAATRDSVDRLGRQASDLGQALTQTHQQLERLGRIVREAAERAAPPDVNAMLQKISRPRQTAEETRPPAATAAAPLSPPQPSSLTDDLLAFLQGEQQRAPLQSVELPQLYRYAKNRHPSLTLGAFHDWLRQMRDARRVRLSPYTQAMYRLPEPESAMILGREVIYYVERA